MEVTVTGVALDEDGLAPGLPELREDVAAPHQSTCFGEPPGAAVTPAVQQPPTVAPAGAPASAPQALRQLLIQSELLSALLLPTLAGASGAHASVELPELCPQSAAPAEADDGGRRAQKRARRGGQCELAEGKDAVEQLHGGTSAEVRGGKRAATETGAPTSGSSDTSPVGMGVNAGSVERAAGGDALRGAEAKGGAVAEGSGEAASGHAGCGDVGVGNSGSGGDADTAHRLIAACWEAMERYAPLQPPAEVPETAGAPADEAGAEGAEPGGAAQAEREQWMDVEGSGPARQGQRSMPTGASDLCALGWELLAANEWELRLLMSQAGEGADGGAEWIGQTAATSEGGVDGTDEGGDSEAGQEVTDSLGSSEADRQEAEEDRGVRAGAEQVLGAGGESVSRVSIAEAAPAHEEGGDDAGPGSGGGGAAHADADAGSGGVGDGHEDGFEVSHAAGQPPSVLEAHLASVAAGLVRRHCVVPQSDPLVAEYAAARRDALQL